MQDIDQKTYLLKMRQNLSLEDKIRLTNNRIKQWYEFYEGFKGNNQLKTKAVHVSKTMGDTRLRVEEKDFANNKRLLRNLDSDALAGARTASFPCALWRVRGAS